ncbi:MAG: hypothetical protein NTU57_02340 [Candidatus Aenigmarchaeota archaeon]|nr:hypothetical protein [Candidatus Aenigmarchaeota archaeon]
MAKQVKIIKCPFCNDGDVEITMFTSVLNKRTGPYGGNKPKFERSAEQMYVNTIKCPKCGRSGKDIQRVMKTGKTKQLSHEERIEMLKKRGLPLVLDSKN